MFPRLVASRGLADADDVAAVLHGRVDRWAAAAGSRRQAATDLIAGLIPRAKGVADEDMAKALRERDDAMERRAITLAEQAVEHKAEWVRKLGSPPADPAMRTAWLNEVRVVAAYRDRWNISGMTVVDSREKASSIEQIGHQKRAHAAAERALTISDQARREHHQSQPVDVTVGIEQSRGVEL